MTADDFTEQHRELGTARGVRGRLALAFLLALLGAGSFALWTVVPAAVLLVLSKLTDSNTTILVAALFAVPLAIGLFAVALTWIDRLYVRVAERTNRGSAGPQGLTVRAKGPLEALVVASLVISIATLVIWMIFFAENQFPYTQPIPA